MTKPLTIRDYMSPTVHVIGPQQMLQDARAMMVRHALHHLPVVEDGKLVGLISSRDLDYSESYYDGNAASIRVDYAMATDVYTATLDQSLDSVADHIVTTRQGSAVVVDEGKVVGIFTMVDACRALCDMVRNTPRATGATLYRRFLPAVGNPLYWSVSSIMSRDDGSKSKMP